MLATILTTFIVGMALLILPSKAVEAYKNNQQAQAEKPVEFNKTEK
jgi:hypothetical protein